MVNLAKLFFSTTVLLFSFNAKSQTKKYNVVLNRIEAAALSNAANAQIFTLGVNDFGEPIKGLKIGNGPNKALVVGTHHGNEYGSTEVAVGLAEALAKNPIKDLTVYVIPVLNITGYNIGNRYERNLSGTMIDPNRDYTGPCVKTRPFQLKSTKALADFIDQEKIVISATLHTFFPAVVYPWGISTRDLSTPHDAEYIRLVKAATIESGYQIGNNTEVLYPADGTFEDYAYWKHGIWSLLFELGFSHNPDKQAIINMVNSNTPGIRRFLEIASRQRVTDFAFKGKCSNNKMLQRVFLE